MFPMAGGRWLTAPEDWAVLVTENSSSSLEVSVYNFAGRTRLLPGRALRLEAGRYQSELACEDGFGEASAFRVTTEMSDFSAEIPPGVLCRLRIGLEIQ